jgi:SAM-dependent methyltransferase
MRCLRTFAHIVQLLQLGLRAEVLDVGCGPGWLSELLARCGYSVTGIDISPDMVEIARERVLALGEIGEGLEAQAEFHAMPVRDLPWSSRFDAAILYDTMHHFDNEVETLEAIRRTLVPGAQLFIHEGVRPPKGSPGEQTLIEEMKRYGTLESPFDPEYLAEVVERAGFVQVRRFAEVDELVDLSESAGRFSGFRRRRLQPEYNVVHARNPSEHGYGEPYAARLEARGSWRLDGDHLVLEVEVTNAGSAHWEPAQWYPFPPGSVTVGPYWPGPAGERESELDRVALPRPLAPGESAAVELRVPRDAAAGHDAVALDLVREGMFWFADKGSAPLVVPFGS